MKRICCVLLAMLCILTSCSKPSVAAPWQEQYDLGVRYLSEGNYQEAILAFTAAIEIDPKRAEAYVGRADAYVGSGETEENLFAALADYEEAVQLDESIVNAWLGIADVLIRRGEYDRAIEILQDALSKTGNDERIALKIAEMEAGTFADSAGKTRKSVHIENGEIIQYWIYEYDEDGNNVKTLNYKADGTVDRTEISEFNENGLEVRCVETDADGSVWEETFEYDSAGRRIKEMRRDSDGTVTNYTIITYDDVLRTQTHSSFSDSGETEYVFIIECDENGVNQRASNYKPDQNGELYLDYYVEYIWNEDGSYGGFEHFQVAPIEQDSDGQ